MGKWKCLGYVAWLAVTACAIEDENPADPRRRPATEQRCAANTGMPASIATATPIKRLAKAYVGNAIADFLSQFDDGPRASLLSALESRLALIPGDESESYSIHDDTVTVDHVEAIFGLAAKFGALVNDDENGFGNELLKVCGAGANKSALADDGCLTRFIQHYGRKTFRRPLTAPEIEDFKTTFRKGGESGLGVLVGRMIAHPRFFYRFDSEGDIVSGTEGLDGTYQLSKWELLSKITFLFWASPPTSALYDRVAKEDIREDGSLTALVDEVLADERAERGILGFFREWLRLDDTQTPATDGNVLAAKELVAAAGLDGLPLDHRADMIQEVLDLAKYYTLTTEGRFSDLFTSSYSFARTDALATVYGVPAWDGSAEHLVPFPEGQRSGLLTRAAMVASNTQYTRPILKGKRVMTRLLCKTVSPPPPSLDIRPLDHRPTATTRAVTSEATEPSACQGCHRSLNSYGFVTEGFDPLGRFRTEEIRFAQATADVLARLPVDTRTAIALGSATTEVNDGVALGKAIADSPEAQRCFVDQYFLYVNGRSQDPTNDACALESMRSALTGPGSSLKTMLRASVRETSFRQRKVK